MKKHINAFCGRYFSNIVKAYVFVLKLFRKACFAAKMNANGIAKNLGMVQKSLAKNLGMVYFCGI